VGPFLGISRVIDRINTAVGRAAAWLILAAVLISAGNAIVRKALDISSNAWLEAQWYLFGAVFMLCAAYTLLQNEHVRIDILVSRFSHRTRSGIEIFGHIFFLMPFAVLMLYLSVPFFLRSYRLGEHVSDAGGLILWPAKILLPIGFALLALQGISELIKRIAILRGDLPDEAAPDEQLGPH
jgi:TRAP-type mannitol/chloroaromatic compound transport system permease small subunit